MKTDFAPQFGMRHALAVILVIGLLALLALALFPRAAAADQARTAVMNDGRQEFEEACQSCHGADGTGTGSLAVKLVKPPKDLTQISAANGGLFPFWRIFDVIAGETPVEGHDTHQMPDYYARLKADDNKPGYLPAPIRILVLTHYLESIQQK